MNSIDDSIQNSSVNVESLLDEKSSELEELRRSLRKLEKELQKVNRFNDDLQNQVKLLNAKLGLHREFVKRPTISVETQTDTYFDGPVFDSYVVDHNDWISQSIDHKTSVSELVRRAAELNANVNDYVYDSKSKTYFSQSSGWYYYPDRELFFDPHTNNYYKYDSQSKTFRFYASFDANINDAEECERKARKRECKRRAKSVNHKIESKGSPKGEGELDSTSSEQSWSDSSSVEDVEKCVNYSCVRMIVKRSTSLDEGSLLLVSCKGAKVGNEEKCDVFIPDDCVSKLHAVFTFDDRSQTFYLKDAESDEGSFINDNKLHKNETYAVKHGDIVCFGDSQFLLHIHEGRDVSCIHCEPGCVQASLKTHKSRLASENSEKERRNVLNKMKKKYGIYSQMEIPFQRKDYKDRADERRKTVGSDNPYEKTGEGTAYDKPLTVDNKGYKMMQKMGWKRGLGLGREESGRISPIPLEVRPEKAGLGFRVMTNEETRTET